MACLSLYANNYLFFANNTMSSVNNVWQNIANIMQLKYIIKKIIVRGLTAGKQHGYGLACQCDYEKSCGDHYDVGHLPTSECHNDQDQQDSETNRK